MQTHPLDVIRWNIRSPADAVRWACILEATAPKAGNVHPGRSFPDLQYTDFVIAANIVAEQFASEGSLAARMHRAVVRSRERTGTNVNLGIVLLLGPLFESLSMTTESVRVILDSFTLEDGGVLFDAIRAAGASGLSSVDEMDVNRVSGPVDVVAAMRSAANRDSIAYQYANNFRDLLEHVVPLVDASISTSGDVLGGIARAHLHLLATRHDSLILRKHGPSIAADVSQRAVMALQDVAPEHAFDEFLRAHSPRLNPGTTADLIAAALFVLLRLNNLGT